MYAVPQLSPRYGYQAAFPPQQQASGSFPGSHFAKGGGGGYAAGARPMPAPQQNGADYNCEVCEHVLMHLGSRSPVAGLCWFAHCTARQFDV